MLYAEDIAPLPVEAVIYGTVALDRFFYEANFEIVQERAGGEAFNTAVALDGWGTSTLLAGTQRASDDEGISLGQLLNDPQTGLSRARRWELHGDTAATVTPCCNIRVTRDGERTMSGRGFGQAVAPPPLPDTILSQCSVFACDPNLGEPATRETLRAADFGCQIVAMDFFREPAIVRRAQILVTSPEAMRRFGAPEFSTPEVAVRTWCESGGAQTAILTLGVEGGVVCDRDAGVFRFPACPVSQVVDTTGAGDAFRAGLCYGLLQQWTLRQMLGFASAAAALHCETPGAASRSSISIVLARQRLLLSEFPLFSTPFAR